jgi:hypothetical protein
MTMNYVRSLFSVVSRLKIFWLLVIVMGPIVVALGIIRAGPGSFAGQLWVYVGGAMIGFALNAFFSRQDQFLLRGCRDLVYLVWNCPFRPRFYELHDRKSLNALGGLWHEITHVSERFTRLFGRERLSLQAARLYRVKGESSVFAVILNTRYGIPNPETLESIWGVSPVDPRVNIVEPAELDQWLPGRDLVSIHYWPEKDRPSSQRPIA